VDAAELAALLGRGSRLRFEVGDDVGDSHYLRAFRDGDFIGAVTVVLTLEALDVGLAFEPLHCRSQDVVDVLRAVAGLLEPTGAPELRLHSSAVVVRITRMGSGSPAACAGS